MNLVLTDNVDAIAGQVSQRSRFAEDESMRVGSFLLGVAVVLVLLSLSAVSSAQVSITVAFGPPALPVYVQPPCPGDGYIWTPGYWAWDLDFDDYYWVPGTWVLPPETGFLWTPPWWGWDDGVYVFHEGYWGPVVGFYGGIDYGFGYFGEGFVGGRWDHDHFYYNRAVTNVNVVHIHNVYNEAVHEGSVNRVSYNGGPGGIEARPRPEDERAARERHIAAVAAQTHQMEEAHANRELRASVNEGKPPIAATERANEFRGGGVVGAREAGAPYHPPARAVHPKELPPLERPTAPHAGNEKLDREYERQREELFNRQNQERQRLQQEQEREHQRMEHGQASQAQRQEMERRHEQQTMQLQMRQMGERQRQIARQREPGRR